MIRLIVLNILFFSVISLDSKAATLQSLARHSAMLLAISESETLQKECKTNAEKISEASQKLKIKIDEKINSLTSKDYKILSERASNCEKDCTCAIYSLAFEAKEKSDASLAQKASQETAENRKSCTFQIKKKCSYLNVH